MGGSGVILSTNIALRNDGLPYANSREPNDPGVAVYFRYGKREMCFACDAYTTVRENAYAIAKSIEALRVKALFFVPNRYNLGVRKWCVSMVTVRPTPSHGPASKVGTDVFTCV
jgi:hypothetical protein